MPRYVWPTQLILYAAEVSEAKAQLVTEAFAEANRFRKPPVDPPGMPVALRWAVNPLLGFPRAPFSVWRRPSDLKPAHQLPGGSSSGGPPTTVALGGDLYLVRFQATPAASATLVVDATDSAGEPIPGQRISFTSTAVGELRCPGMAGLRLTGQGTVSQVTASLASDVANRTDWTLIEVVGFPFHAGEIALPVYDARPQGFAVASATGYDAAMLRLAIARILHLTPPPTGDATIPRPAWPGPDPARFLSALRDPDPSITPPSSVMSLVTRCLHHTDDGDPAKLQGDYVESISAAGLAQATGASTATSADPVQVEAAVTQLVALAVTHDSTSATGLGFGTIDLPPVVAGAGGVGRTVRRPPGVVPTGYDYLVTATFRAPFLAGPVELAALAQPLPSPTAPSGLTAIRFAADRPLGIDQAETEVVQLTWALPPTQESFAVLASRAPGQVEVLNTPRRMGAGGYDPVIPAARSTTDGDVPAGASASFNDLLAKVPFSGSSTTNYLVAGTDVVGRWTGWVRTAHVASAPPPAAPGLLSVAIEQHTAAHAGPVVPGTLVVDFTWDWTDRSPDRVELSGTFFPASAAAPPNPGFVGGLQKSPGAAFGPNVVISFDPEGSVILPFGSGISCAEVLPPTDPSMPVTPGADVRTYRARLAGMSCDYSTDSRLAYSVTIRGAEHLRPSQLSGVVGPRVARVDNPLPPTAPTLPADIIWTALPDATGQARAVLTWPAVARATGYYVWEATEAALRAAADPTFAGIDFGPGTTIVARADALWALLNGSPEAQALSLQAFSRLNERGITATSMEVVLPGDADTLYAYRVSAITDTAVESQRSASVALVGVPRRNTPGQPVLTARASARGDRGVELTVVSGPGVAPAEIRVHRCRRLELAQDVGTMGPPLPFAPTAWAPVVVAQFLGDTTGRPGIRVLDEVEPGWYPYHYRVVAVGASAPAFGRHAGVSIPSPTRSVVLPPSEPPHVEVLDLVANKANGVLTFTTDLPVRPSPAGRATLEVSASAIAADGRSVVRTRLLSVGAHDVAVGSPFPLLDVGTGVPVVSAEISRDGRGEQGTFTYSVRLPAEVVAVYVVATDPLGRSTSQPFEA